MKSPGRINPLDFQQALGCLGKPRRCELYAKEYSGKGLDPKARPFCHRQVRGLQDCANREGRMRGSLRHLAPVPLPVVRTPPLRHWMQIFMGTQEPTKWAFPATMATPESTAGTPTRDEPPRCSPPPTRSRCAPPPRRLPREARPRYCRQVKHNDKQIRPTETTQAFYQLICL